MPLLRVPEPFDHPDWLFELKHDGFRALAVVDRYSCTFVSRNGHTFTQWPQLQEEVAHAVRVERAVLDGEIVCLEPGGRSDFYSLMFRRQWPFFYAFDLLSLEGEDLRGRPLLERKRLLRGIMAPTATRLRCVDPLEGRGRDLYELACQHDTEGIVAKWSRGTYHADGATTSWLKIKNPAYTQAEGRHELFAARRSGSARRPPGGYRLDPTAGVAAVGR
jgi:bifunctional non-homologous end joining protein LigD